MKASYSKYINSYSILAIISILLLGSCASPQTSRLLQEKKPIYPAQAFKDYRLQINDEIYCSIFTNNKDFTEVFNGVVSNSESASSTYSIYETGNITIPFFGDIYILGLSIAEAEETIQNQMRLAIPDAQVKVFLKNNEYYIVSDGINGRYPIYKDNMTIFQALASGGGVPNSDYKIGSVKILRQDKTGRTILKEFDLRSASIIESEFYYIKPNDIIYYSKSASSFFRINSFQSLVSTLLAPISVVLTLLAFRIN